MWWFPYGFSFPFFQQMVSSIFIYALLVIYLSNLVKCLFLSLGNFYINFFFNVEFSLFKYVMGMNLWFDLQIFSVCGSRLFLFTVSLPEQFLILNNSNCHCFSYRSDVFGIVARKSLLNRSPQRDSSRFSCRSFKVLDDWSMSHWTLLSKGEQVIG